MQASGSFVASLYSYVLMIDCVAVSSQVRYAHTDIQVPDFSDYRRDDVKDPRSKSMESASSRRSFTYMVVGGKLGHLSLLLHIPVFNKQEVT